MTKHICQNLNKMPSKLLPSRKLAYLCNATRDNLGCSLSVNAPSCWILNCKNYSGRSAESSQHHSFLLRVRGVSAFNPLTTHAYHTLTNRYCSIPVVIKRCESTKLEEDKKDAPLTSAAKLKKAVAEYGSTVIIFHITISLFSLGIFYVLVDSGLDVTVFLSKYGINNEGLNKLASNAGTFALAYAIHKVFAPVRIGVTLTATPFIVRYFRKIGWLKN